MILFEVNRLRGRGWIATAICTPLLAGCASAGQSGQRTAGSSALDAKLSKAEGYRVTGCHDYAAGSALAREVGDPGAHAYQCAGGLGVMVEPNGSVSDFDAPNAAPAQLTAGLISTKIIAAVKQDAGAAPRRVNCGTSTDVTSGAVLPCRVTLSNGRTAVLYATVHGSGRSFNVTLATDSSTSGSSSTTSTTATAGSQDTAEENCPGSVDNGTGEYVPSGGNGWFEKISARGMSCAQAGAVIGMFGRATNWVLTNYSGVAVVVGAHSYSCSGRVSGDEETGLHEEFACGHGALRVAWVAPPGD